MYLDVQAISPQHFCLNVVQLSPLDPPRDVAERVAPVNQFQKFAGLRLKIETQQT